MWLRAGSESGGCTGESGGWESSLHLQRVCAGAGGWVEVRAVGGLSGEFSAAQGSRFVHKCEAALSHAGVARQW